MIPSQFNYFCISYKFSNLCPVFMSDIVRVKPKKQYNWHQTKTLVTLTLPFPNTTLQKLSIQSYTTFLIVSNKESKSNPLFFDLQEPISKISTKYSNGALEIVMVKQEQKEWNDLVIHLPIADLRKRRDQAIKNKQEVGKGVIKKKEQLDVEFDRKGIQELMKLQQDQKQKLKEKKRIQKQQAQQNIFKDIDTRGNIKAEPKKLRQQNWQDKQRIALKLLEKQQQEERKQQYIDIQQRKKKNIIFTNQQVQKSEVQTLMLQEEFEEIPIRKSQNIKLTLTQKPYPHVAARQTHFDDLPVPKGTKNAIKGDQPQKLQQRNPLWLKDKGDKFVNNKDYISAINAYNQALKLDKDLLAAQMNRSFCHMKLFNFNECLDDCEFILAQLKSQFQRQNSEMRQVIQEKIIKIRCRMAISLGWKGKIQESIKEFQGIQQLGNLSDKLKIQVADSIKLLQSRVLSNQIKEKGDESFKLRDYAKAEKYYVEASSIDGRENEYSIANNALVQLKLNNYERCIQECDRAEKIITSLAFTSDLSINNSHQSRSQVISLLTKIYLRKGTALKELKKYPESLSILRNIKSIDPNQHISSTLIKEIQQIINKQKYTSMKSQADNLVRTGNLQPALAKYKQCLSILTSSDLIQYLSVLLNQCVCYIKLQNYNEIVSVCIRGLKLVNSTSGVDYHLSKQDKQKVSQFKVRFLVRKAKSYLNLKQFYNAESDVREALKIQIKNQKIKAELEELRKQIAKK